MRFRARQFEFQFPRPVLVMGIVNVTPDSFFDGGKSLNARRAVSHALELAGQGAEILDIGGESTRPGARPVSEKEELRRVIPVIEKLAGLVGPSRRDDRTARRAVPARILISVDTMKPAVARAALAAGASIVNDVAASRAKDAMWKVVAGFRAGYICMHAQGSPQTMQKHPRYKYVVREVDGFFRERLNTLTAHGIARDQIVFDPGIGFGKTLEHNLQLLANLRRFTTLGRPVMLGASRKSFIGKLLGAGLKERLPGSLACATLAAAAGVQIIRAHDVAETVQAVRLAEACLARKII